jgi:hypothetical protein
VAQNINPFVLSIVNNLSIGKAGSPSEKSINDNPPSIDFITLNL